MSTISTATLTPTNLVNPQQQTQQQQQSPSYMSGNAGNNMNHYHQQAQYSQQQYQPIQHQNHMNSFNYNHPMFRMQQQQQQPPPPHQVVVKNEPPAVDNDPYRFVDDDLSNGMSAGPTMHQSHQQHMSSPAMSGNYSASSSPMPSHMQQQQAPSVVSGGNASLQQFSEHHMSPHHMNHVNYMSHQQHIQSQQQQQQQHNMMNGSVHESSGHGGMNASGMMMMNDTPKKRGRKKKLRDENGYVCVVFAHLARVQVNDSFLILAAIQLRTTDPQKSAKSTIALTACPKRRSQSALFQIT
jgi:hypothetical protein